MAPENLSLNKFMCELSKHIKTLAIINFYITNLMINEVHYCADILVLLLLGVVFLMSVRRQLITPDIAHVKALNGLPYQ